MKRRNHFVLAGVVGAMLVLAGCVPPVSVPTSYDTYIDKNNTFKVLAPAGWACYDGTDKKQLSWADFTSGDAEIDVHADGLRSLITDMAVTGIIPMVPGMGGMLSVAKVHSLERSAFEKKMNVKEEEAAVIKTGFDEGRRSEFKGTEGPIRGCRVTAVVGDKRIKVVCRCSTKDWDRLKPVFDKVIDSLAPATAPESPAGQLQQEEPEAQSQSKEPPQGEKAAD